MKQSNPPQQEKVNLALTDQELYWLEEEERSRIRSLEPPKPKRVEYCQMSLFTLIEETVEAAGTERELLSGAHV